MPELTLQRPGRQWGGALLLAGGLLLLAGYTLYPAQHPPPPGPLLAAAREAGVLKVALRSYPRPTLSREALVPEPDLLDAQLAQYLGSRLGVAVRFTAPADAQLLINPAQPPRQPPASLRAAPEGALLALRREAGASLAGQSVCVAQGSPWQAEVEKHGARAQPYPSTLRASVAFLGGECRYLADSRVALDGLLKLPEWRFYRRLPLALNAPVDARVYLAAADPASQAWLQGALARWHADGGQASAWASHADELLSDSLKIADGLSCH
ncbi:ABC transporter substrate-binding protein [Pseudomonas sp. NPDC007930]|uniref:ABC transporter substrate-binding protein n=1 Tax=Pseudomonas sp. NPDC007930 TaxID=3364417 RepID=UPI0036E3D459